jgi:DNA modification methylase
MGSGTTLFECENLNRHFIGFDINKEIINFVNAKMQDSDKINFAINECDVADKEKFDLAMNNQKV